MIEELVPQEVIENKIYLIRGQKVMLDIDLAELYEVKTKQLNRQVRRNIERFPKDFMFQLTKNELENLRCQIGTSSWGGIRYHPCAFTEHGILMLSSVLKSKRAIHVNIQIMRVFVRIKQMVSAHKELAHKLEQLEQKVGKHSEDIQLIFQAIHKLMEPAPAKVIKKVGFLK
jgi:hypothetical protein